MKMKQNVTFLPSSFLIWPMVYEKYIKMLKLTVADSDDDGGKMTISYMEVEVSWQKVFL